MTRVYFHKAVIFFLLLFVFGVSTALAWEKEADGQYTITDFELFEDKNGEYDFNTISSPLFTDRFRHYNKGPISLGISQSVYWLRFLPPNDDSDVRYLLQLGNPNIDKIDVHIPVVNDGNTADVHYVDKKWGVSRPSANRDIWDNTWVFAVPRQYAQGQYIYLRLESISVLRLPIVVWTENAFLTDAFIKNIRYGIFYGVLLAMFLYNLFIFFVLRDRAYLFYILYLAFMLFYQLDIHGHLKLWLDFAYPIHSAIFWICLTAVFAFSICFTASFLQVHAEETVLSKAMALLLAIALVQGLLGVAGHSIWANQIARCLGILEPLTFIVLAIVRWRQGFHPAIYYLIAWGILSLGILVWILAPSRILAAHVLMLATGSEAVLLSLALSDRFKMLRLKELALTRHIHYYRDLSLTDELTGLYNRRYLKNKLRQELTIAANEARNLALIIIDIDFFKNYNDTYGHWQGDQVLIRLGEVLLTVLNSTQMAFRFGGEEFVVLLPNIGCDEAVVIAERIRTEFEREDFEPIAGDLVHATVSVGLSNLTSGDTAEKLFQRTDKALYKAKTSGRNRVAVL